ncbi:sterol desaturase/sphingolipid hydroxylase (fatty acid hydroxylase superfamily) [Novosphingobium kunmingense]|uniref:Sterol desaturase/sphingolipid hydroxylase (Fatty acid hydroxylase superfamily) n=1 Tax=Novosphingobium kunmingense TaxID=1211806 RepID=A0A2N0H3S2_9SPHN|nr:sterol desaturase family protein [Novosphingobium kunmingense]PKB13581.1 sterol desaturase/sphingolipid hydroxylase (fatty acid hydroxylase superfamily) [Novosphingobium kunmingense]
MNPELAQRHPFLLLVILSAVLAEFLWRRRSGSYDLRAASASFGVAVGQALIRPVSALLMVPLFQAAYALSPFAMPVQDWRTWAAGFVAVEFAYYWFHRASHTIRWMWATHAVHHSAAELVLPAAIRLGWTELFSLGWAFFAALMLIGFPPIVVVTLLGLNLLYQFPLHTEAIDRLGPLEWVLNTPSHHRAHHSNNPGWLDCNFGGVVIVFDRMFGTFRAEPVERGLTYGLVHSHASHNPLRIALHEWRRLFADIEAANGLLGKLRVAAGRP